MTHTHTTIHRSDYRVPDFYIPGVELRFDIHEEHTLVSSVLSFRRNAAGEPGAPLVLQGEGLELRALSLDGRTLGEKEYRRTPKELIIPGVGDEGRLEVTTRIYPRKNTSLEGLYFSGKIYCTQNEPEGFRHITCFPDRPDVMSVFTTTITAPKAACPVLLANGNPGECAGLPDGRHSATWHDPFPKPAYLFALVAGDLSHIEDHFSTCSGRSVRLRVYVYKGNEDRACFAMESLKKAMRWDEKRFGREYDLDVFNIVAVDDFNFGAMENKGLNIFNSSAVLADTETETDANFERIQGVVAHEYFHNWTGDRITLRDWFQLTLKEGLTVFRDQEFTAEMTSRSVKRISDARAIREYQFPEDAGPMSHPIQPDSYIEINNFYTVTIYEKGAEVIRMIQTLLGEDGFRRGMDCYFERHDGQAVTTEDFLKSMEDGADADLSQFRRWYRQSGTPRLRAEGVYDRDACTYSLTLTQEIPADQEPFVVPVSLGLLGREGRDLPLVLAEGDGRLRGSTLVMTGQSERFVFTGITEQPVPSLLRGFSAPVDLVLPLSRGERLFLLKSDTDPVNRWEAGQCLAMEVLREMIAAVRSGTPAAADSEVVQAFAELVPGPLPRDPAWYAAALQLPSLMRITEDMEVPDYQAAFTAREQLLRAIALAARDRFSEYYRELSAAAAGSARDQQSINYRKLKNTLLAYLARLDDEQMLVRQYRGAQNMTDRISALALLADRDTPAAAEALADFASVWSHDALVMNKWFAVQAGSRRPDVLSLVRTLESHPAYDPRNPNKLRALPGSFSANLVRFHDTSGEGYRYLADKIIEINSYNPMMAARLTNAFRSFARLGDDLQGLMRRELERIAGAPDLSSDVYEIVTRTLHRGS